MQNYTDYGRPSGRLRINPFHHGKCWHVFQRRKGQITTTTTLNQSPNSTTNQLPTNETYHLHGFHHIFATVEGIETNQTPFERSRSADSDTPLIYVLKPNIDGDTDEQRLTSNKPRNTNHKEQIRHHEQTSNLWPMKHLFPASTSSPQISFPVHHTITAIRSLKGTACTVQV